MNKIIDKKLINPAGKVGTISTAEVNNEGRLIVTVQFSDRTAKYDLEVAFNNNFLKMKEDDQVVSYVNNLLTSLKDEQQRIKSEREAKRVEAYNELKQKEEAEKQAMKEKKMAESAERARRATIKKFEEMYTADYDVSNESKDYYFTIGWFAAHIGAITAKLPDYLDGMFSVYFGSDAPRTLIDSNKTTTGGFKTQWSYSFTANIKNKENIPAAVYPYLNEAGVKLTDTSFIWKLIEAHNFKFGKIQNVESIKETVPASMLEYFNEGYNS